MEGCRQQRVIEFCWIDSHGFAEATDAMTSSASSFDCHSCLVAMNLSLIFHSGAISFEPAVASTVCADVSMVGSSSFVYFRSSSKDTFSLSNRSARRRSCFKTNIWTQGSHWNQGLLSMQECAKFPRQAKAKRRIACSDTGITSESF